MSGSSPQRYYYLDSLRVAAMSMGIFVHGATLGEFGWIEKISTVSDAFRMALFFMISGFLAATLLSRQSVQRFLGDRLRSLVVPLLFGLLVLNPITHVLVFDYAFESEAVTLAKVFDAVLYFQGGEPAGLVWHVHLWFLISLICYVLVAPFVLGPVQIAGKRMAQTSTGGAMCWGMLFAIILGTLVLMVGVNFVEAVAGELPWVLRVTIRYWPFYLAGLAISSSAPLRDGVLRVAPVMGLVVLAAYFLLPRLHFRGAVDNAAELAVMTGLRWWACVTILALGKQFLNHPNLLSELFSRAIYTIYLLHYMLIYILANLYKKIASIDNLAYWLICFSTIVLGLAAHVWVVERSRVLLYLLNGRLANPGGAGDVPKEQK